MKKIAAEIKVTSYFRKYTGEQTDFSLELEEGMQISGILRLLHIPEDEVGSILVNEAQNSGKKKAVNMDYQVAQNDQIILIPQILGG